MCHTVKVKQIESAQLLANSLSCKAASLLGPLVTELDSFSQCLLGEKWNALLTALSTGHVHFADLKTF